MSACQELLLTVAVGTGATAVMDLWLVLIRRLGVPVSGFGLVGRWIGHMPRGRFVHPSISRSAPVRGELALGWATHYVIGVAYAGLLVALAGAAWLHAPTLPIALAFGVATVAAPLLVMQPAMGAGFAASKTPTPLLNCLRSVANHAVFGAGLYLTAWLISRISG